MKKTLQSRIAHTARSVRTMFIAAALLPMVLAHATPPERMAFQGYLVDANGVALGVSAPQNFDVQFRIFDLETGGVLLWAEQQAVTVDNGNFSVILGEGTPVPSAPRPPFAEVFRGVGSGERYIEVSVAFAAGGAFNPILPRLRLLAGPYAYSAGQALQLVTPEGSVIAAGEAGAFTVGGTLSASGTITSASGFSGSGSNLTQLNAAAVSSGTLADARLSGNVAMRNTANTFAAYNQFSAGLGLGNNLVLNDASIRLRSASDVNHGLGWYGAGRSFAGYNGPDGPVLYGNLGGILGTANGTRALRWDNAGRVHLEGTARSLNFGMLRTQMLNLWGDAFGIGVQDNTQYFRTSSNFAWYRGGGHSDSTLDAGGGFRQMYLDSGGSLNVSGWLTVGGNIYASSEMRFGSSWRYGFMRYTDGEARDGGGRRIYIGGSGSSTQMDNGNRWASYDGDGNWDFSSDIRLKEEIEAAEPLLDRVLQIQLKRFYFKGEDRDDKHLGVIAQEMQPLFPDFITTGAPEADGEKYLMVAYTDFGLLAVGALQELAERHAAKVAALEAENAALAERLAALEAVVEQLASAAR